MSYRRFQITALGLSLALATLALGSCRTSPGLAAHSPKRAVTGPFDEALDLPLVYSFGAIHGAIAPSAGDWIVCLGQEGGLLVPLSHRQRYALMRSSESHWSWIGAEPDVGDAHLFFVLYAGVQWESFMTLQELFPGVRANRMYVAASSADGGLVSVGVARVSQSEWDGYVAIMPPLEAMPSEIWDMVDVPNVEEIDLPLRSWLGAVTAPGSSLVVEITGASGRSASLVLSLLSFLQGGLETRYYKIDGLPIAVSIL